MKKFENLMKCVLVIVLAVGVLFPFSAGAEPAGKVIIFNAGSLTIPFAKMEKREVCVLIPMSTIHVF